MSLTSGLRAPDRSAAPRTSLNAASALQSADCESRSSINLVPSENRISPLAQLPLSTDFYNRYFFNQALDPDFWQFRGGQSVHDFETVLANDSLMRLANARYVNTRPISGMSAMMMAIVGLGGVRSSAVLTIAETSGGHFATAGLVDVLGYMSITVGVRAGRVDEVELIRALTTNTVSLIYLDLQNSLHGLDVATVAELVREYSPDTVLHVDCSHTLGLVLGEALANPLDLGADSMGGSTHKTFPGPHKGVIMTNSQHLDVRLREAQFKLISSHHFAETMSLGLAATEFEHFGSDYAPAVIGNAKAFAQALSADGFDVVRADSEEFTHTHQVWITGLDGPEVERLADRLYRGGIRVNVQTNMPGFEGPMLRLGVAEATFEGATFESMKALSATFKEAFRSGLPSANARELRETFGPPYFYEDFSAQEIGEICSSGGQGEH